MVLLTPLDLVGPEIEIGWRLRRTCWDRGYATEAARPVLHHAFHTLGLPEVIADINPDNMASRRVAQKLGFRAVGNRWVGDRKLIRYIAKLIR